MVRQRRFKQRIRRGKARTRASREDLAPPKWHTHTPWYQAFNAWLADTIAGLNVLLFLAYLVAGGVIGMEAGGSRGGEEGAVGGAIVGLFVGLLAGIFSCGLVAILVTMCRHLEQIAETGRRRSRHSSVGEDSAEVP